VFGHRRTLGTTRGMGRPQDNRLQRSGNTPIDPDHIATEVTTRPDAPRDETGDGPIPDENRPGHHPPVEQDKPDLDDFAERLGVEPDSASSPEEIADEVGARVRTTVDSVKLMAEPVLRQVQAGAGRAAEAFDQWRHLAARVEELERRVSELEGSKS
jgi:hypothetical protein